MPLKAIGRTARLTAEVLNDAKTALHYFPDIRIRVQLRA
jgi:hypothetical protein